MKQRKSLDPSCWKDPSVVLPFWEMNESFRVCDRKVPVMKITPLDIYSVLLSYQKSDFHGSFLNFTVFFHLFYLS
jgi:hypothetical protein